MSTSELNEQAVSLIDALGGTCATARICGEISPQAVSQWRRAGIPKAWLEVLKLKRPEVCSAIVAPKLPQM